MPTPTLPILSNAAALALSDQVHAATGAKHWKKAAGEADTPDTFAWFINTQRQILELLSALVAGQVVDLGGLNVGVYPMNYRIGATDYAYAGSASTALTANATNYVWLDADQSLESSTSAWPGGDHVKLAIVVTNADDIVSLTDQRMRNWQIGIVNNWYSVPAGADVDFNGKGALDIGPLQLRPATQLTIATGVITPTQAMHKVAGQGGVDDQLDTITADSGLADRLLILESANAGIIEIRDYATSGGNIETPDGASIFLTGAQCAILYQNTVGTWRVLAKARTDLTAFNFNVNAAGYQLTNLGKTSLTSPTTRTVSSGAITADNSWHRVETEAMGATDDLDTINGGVVGQLLILEPVSAARVTTVKHNTGNIRLQNGKDFAMDATTGLIVLQYNGTVWKEIARQPLLMSHLVNTGQVIPYPLPAYLPGTVSSGDRKWNFIAPVPLLLKGYSGYAKTPPSGASCIVRLEVDGASVHASDGEAVNIADGTNSDDSVTISVAVNAGQRITAHVVQGSSAADVTLAIRAFVDARVAA